MAQPQLGQQHCQWISHDRLEIQQESELSFVLDLKEEGRTLSLSADEGPTVLLFGEMRSHLDEEEGYVPAVSMAGSGDSRVRLIGTSAHPSG